MLFRDVVTNISLGRQDKNVLAFYIKRLGQEQTSRVATAILAVVLVGFQAFTFLAPPQVSEASAGSGNDIVYGGVRSRDDLLRKYDSNPELRAIYGRVRITRDDIARMTPGSVNSSLEVWSMGRYQHGENNVRLDVPGAHTAIWLRPLRVWGNNKVFSALQGRNADGARAWILFDCGNPVIEVTHNPGTKEVPPSPPPPTIPPPSPTSPPPPPPPPPTPKPAKYSCNSLQAFPDPQNTRKTPPLDVTFVTQSTVENTTLKSFLYDFGDGTTLETKDARVTHTYKKPGMFTARVRVSTSAGITNFSTACEQKLDLTSPNLSYIKQAVNLSLKDKNNQPTNAAGTTVAGGNEIRYTIAVHNSGTGTFEDFVFEENIADILDYADVIDLGGARLVEKTIPGQDKLTQKTLVWSKQDIKPGEQATQQFIVKVKNPIPTTPVGASDRDSFDLKMENIFYGNRIEILLAVPPAKQIEKVSTSLPATGPGVANTGLALFTSGMVFILLRNRLIRKELSILATTEGGENHG